MAYSPIHSIYHLGTYRVPFLKGNRPLFGAGVSMHGMHIAVARNHHIAASLSMWLCSQSTPKHHLPCYAMSCLVIQYLYHQRLILSSYKRSRKRHEEKGVIMKGPTSANQGDNIYHYRAFRSHHQMREWGATLPHRAIPIP